MLKKGDMTLPMDGKEEFKISLKDSSTFSHQKSGGDIGFSGSNEAIEDEKADDGI